LRRDVIWSKPNPMPESVNGWRWERCRIKVKGETKRSNRSEAGRIEGMQAHSGGTYTHPVIFKDCPGCDKCDPNGGYILRKGSGRCTTAHEYIFQFVKSGEYFYDCEAIRESNQTKPHNRGGIWIEDQTNGPMNRGGSSQYDAKEQIRTWGSEAGRNRRSVWEIATQPYPEAHFATYPEKLIEPCIKAGTSEKGCCPECGAPFVRILEPSAEAKERLGSAWHDHQDDLGRGQRGTPPALKGPANITKGWRPSCNHKGDPVPCVVFDPFTGSGTTGAVAIKHGRSFIGSELNPEYIELANRRILSAAEKYGRLTPDMPVKKYSQLGLL